MPIKNDIDLDPYERWQKEVYGNILPSNPPLNENEDDEDIRFERWQEVIEYLEEIRNYNY